MTQLELSTRATRDNLINLLGTALTNYNLLLVKLDADATLDASNYEATLAVTSPTA